MDVEQLLQSKDIRFIPKGGDFEIRCLNPEHEDRNPSLRVDRLTGIFNCFSCGFKGNLFTFFGEKANFLQMKKDTLKNKLRNKLAENVGMNIPTNAVPFDRSWRNISADTFKHFEAFQHNDSDYIGRVVFPIRAISGKIVGFQGRALSPDTTPRYKFAPSGAKFPLYPARPIHNGRVVLVEGIFDMLNLYDKGLQNVVCAFGTQKVTREKLQILKIQNIYGIDIIFDPDEPGEKAAEAIKLLAEAVELDARIINIKSGDPGELTASKVMRLKEHLYGNNSPNRN